MARKGWSKSSRRQPAWLSPRGLNARPGSRMVPSACGVVFAGWGRFRADRLEGPDFERNPGQAAEQAGQVRLIRGDDRPMTVLDSVNRPVAGADASATRRTRQQTRRLCNRWSTRSGAVFRCIACAAALTPPYPLGGREPASSQRSWPALLHGGRVARRGRCASASFQPRNRWQNLEESWRFTGISRFFALAAFLA